ncbi:MAG: hypothetical protein P1U58_00635, partial [Verrucomicrobiales bacterium]|nr:hypothetical protein [Verrucomicrobiales bacterium]
MNEANPLLDPELSLCLIKILSWILIVLGGAKMIIYVIGECLPSFYARIKSDSARRFLTGTGNRLLFGLGGFVTLLFGVIGIALGTFFA